MALLPNTIVYGTTGNNSSPMEKKNGGVVVGITSTTDTTNGPIKLAFPLTSNAIDGAFRRNRVVEASGVAHAFSTKKCVTAGSFAYNQTQYMVIGVATGINGIANTALRFAGSVDRPHRNISLKSKGAKTSTAIRAGYFRYMKISGQRTLWSTAPATNNVSYVLPTNNASNADDQGMYVTYRSVPGELVYMYGTIDPKMKDYPSHN